MSPTKENHLDSQDSHEESHIIQKLFQKLVDSRDPSEGPGMWGQLNPWLRSKTRSRLDEAPRLNFFRLSVLGKRLIQVSLVKQSFSSLFASLSEIEDFFQTLKCCFEKQMNLSGLFEENSTLEVAFQIVYPEVAGSFFATNFRHFGEVPLRQSSQIPQGL